MTDWLGIVPSGNYRISITGLALDQMDRLCSTAGHRETGGVLLGSHSEDQTLATVDEVTGPPNDSESGHSWFRRGLVGLGAELRRRWLARRRTFYLGEWHFHPAETVVPSSQDFAQMQQIASSTRYQCREPLLIILGARVVVGHRSLRAFVCPAGEEATEFERVPFQDSTAKGQG